ncbi:MAG: hypothetical protein V7K69_19240 [Nostoc sp.]|uniref:hypothetical protein n=1 Tax=Nostoc sp. TaxID=1180 RepID=UPI002FFBEA3A
MGGVGGVGGVGGRGRSLTPHTQKASYITSVPFLSARFLGAIAAIIPAQSSS